MDAPYQQRLCLNDTIPGYLEARAKQFHPNEVRECPLTAVYLNVYSIRQRGFSGSTDDDDDDDVVGHDDVDRVVVGIHHVDLDRIFG